MNPNHTMRALLVGVFLVGALAPIVPTAGAVACPNTNSSGGFGGQDSYCDYNCSANHYVHLHVESADPDAMVKGFTQCGNASVDCGWLREECNDSGYTTTAQSGAVCEGHSDEAVRSPLTVHCWSATSSSEPRDIGDAAWLIRISMDAEGATASKCIAGLCVETPAVCRVEAGTRVCVAVL